jgi:uncharacterized lipoprotein YmbA
MIKLLIKFLVLIILAAMMGCGSSKPSRYYLLSELKNQEQKSSFKQQLKIGIGPLRFPEYLQRPQIGFFMNENQLQYAEYDRWAEPLDENFMRVLTENLSELLDLDQVYMYPFIGAPQIDYQIIMDIRKFEMNERSQVVLTVQWEIVKAGDQQPLLTQRSTYVQPVDSDNYISIVAGMSQAVERFSNDITNFIRKII